MSLSESGNMKKGHCRHTIVTLLLLAAFSGQALAAISLSCENTSSPIHFHADIEFAEMGHPHPVSSDESSAQSLDCFLQCACTLNGCTFSVLPSSSLDSPFSLLPANGHFDESVISRMSTPLFRPPILH